MSENKKTKTVTVDVEFIRMAIIMRNRQRKFFGGDRSWLQKCKQAEKEFDLKLTNISKFLQAAKTDIENPMQDGLL